MGGVDVAAAKRTGNSLRLKALTRVADYDNYLRRALTNHAALNFLRYIALASVNDGVGNAFPQCHLDFVLMTLSALHFSGDLQHTIYDRRNGIYVGRNRHVQPAGRAGGDKAT